MSGIELYDLTPQEATALVCPDQVWLAMMTRGFTATPFRNPRCGPKCYRANGFEVHVKPDCRCPR